MTPPQFSDAPDESRLLSGYVEATREGNHKWPQGYYGEITVVVRYSDQNRTGPLRPRPWKRRQMQVSTASWPRSLLGWIEYWSLRHLLELLARVSRSHLKWLMWKVSWQVIKKWNDDYTKRKWEVNYWIIGSSFRNVPSEIPEHG